MKPDVRALSWSGDENDRRWRASASPWPLQLNGTDFFPIISSLSIFSAQRMAVITTRSGGSGRGCRCVVEAPGNNLFRYPDCGFTTTPGSRSGVFAQQLRVIQEYARQGISRRFTP
jgi:hypothetical protein